MTFRDLTTNPHHVLTEGQLAETVALIRWDQETILARMEDDANDIEAALAQRVLDSQP